MMTNHALTHCCCQASLTDQLKKWRVQKEKPWLTWHNIPIFLYTWDVAWTRAPNGTQNKECTIRGGVNLIPEPWGNFTGQGRSISNFWGNKWQKSPKFLGRFEPWKVGAQTLLWGGAWGKNKQCTCTGCTAQCPVWRPCVWGSKFQLCEQQF